MGTELARQFIDKKICSPQEIIITRRNRVKLNRIARELRVQITTKNIKAIHKAEVVILAVRPQSMKDVLKQIANLLTKEQIIISVAVGLELKFFNKFLPHNPVCRAMPNPFLSYNLGVIPYSKNANVSSGDEKQLRLLFSNLCEDFIEIADKDMHVYTTLASSSSAIFYYLFNSFLTSAHNNLEDKQIKKLILLTASSAATYCLKSNESLDKLINDACTPGGMTMEGISYLKKVKTGQHLITALQKIIQRSKQIDKQLA